MNVLLFNGSPRKNWNTAKLLESAAKGAISAGAETELVHLYDLSYTGCKSCFACKLKNNKTDGICIVRDGLRPILERTKEADVIIVGAPVYFSHPSGQTESFLERLLFPLYSYRYENGKPAIHPHQAKASGLILTMNCPEDLFQSIGYDKLLAPAAQMMETVYGKHETLFVKDTCQFADYSKYDNTLFDPVYKEQRKQEVFPQELQRAYDMGRRLVEETIA